MFKNLIIALVLGALLISGIGTVVRDWLDIHIQVDAYTMFEPFASLALVAALTALSVVVVFILASSVIGITLLAMGSIFVGLFITGLSLTWPTIAIIVVALLILKDRKSPTH